MSVPVPEYEVVTTWRVHCDGGEGALGHPRVYYSVDRDDGHVECGYCDKLFVHDSFAAEVLPKFGIAVKS
ncbi:zinc-finger domain-containing protein [Parasulfitobacter algicola]|uniref:Zinc-finger domain-containing protein n=1 Tax=Parasulfitobacter algicola TaxID=2614809 RepID=A0ABX2ILY6_9RHOB|nr:zinc-finger domain-containing protein [Sulfitobacter algicola]NSX53896.1 zinc-finger domain-containing protein [Sulfitobacter algicola]